MGRAALVGAVIAASMLVTALPANAQDEPSGLGFEIDSTEGSPGDEVNGQVAVADIAANCTTDLTAFQARFQELLDLLSATGEGSLMRRFFAGDDFVFENHDQLAFSLTGLVAFGIAQNFGGAAEEALPQTLVMTFADIATQQPVGARGNFDAATGQGSVTVPDLAPGLWAVAATCVGPVLDPDLLEAGIRASGDFLEGLGIPVDPNLPEFEAFVKEFLGDENASALDFVTAIGPDLLQSIVQPDALGVQVFCILDADGTCPADGPPPGEPSDDRGVAKPAQPVRATPTFTG